MSLPPTDEPAPAVADADAQPAGRQRWSIMRRVVGGIVLLLVVLWLVLYITKGRFLKHPFERTVGALTNRQVSVAGDFQLFFDPVAIKFYAEGIRIANPSWATKPMLFAADRIDTRISPWSLIFGKRRLYWLDLTNGAVDLEWNAAHTTNSWTFDDKKGGKPLDFPSIDRATVTGTTVRYLDSRLKLLADLKIDDIQSADATIGHAVGLTGEGIVRSTPFTLTAKLLSPDATVARGQNKLTLTAYAAHNRIDVAGTLPTIADIENVPLQVRATGRNLAELLRIIGVVIPQTRTYALHAQLVQSGTDYRFTRMAGTFGDSDLSGKFTVSNIEPRTHVAAELATRTLDIVDVAPFIGYNPDIVAAQGTVAAAAATGAAPARLLPDTALPVDDMGNFDANVHWTVGTVRSRNVPISNIDVTVALKDRELQISPLTFAMSRGNVAADIMIDAQRRPAHNDYDIRLAPTPMGRLLAGFGVVESGTTGTIHGRIRLSGDGDSMHAWLANANGRMAFVMPAGSLSARNVQLSELDIGVFAQRMFQHQLKEPVALNCGLVAFTARNGAAAADPIIIDTAKNVITGRGGFNLGTEAMDLAFRADGKKFSLFSGQSPVGLKGYFAKPSLDVLSPQLVARAGSALGLALIATPPAAILAFVDVGDAKAAACGPILSAATAGAQRTTKGKPRDDVGNGTPSTTGGKRKKFLGIF
ncbi:AsmA family protein [Sphingomonas bacterium]|uniref:AsmA family protein n=1 Tax=Sphingomonas bacterium TaxID=1895847 RepID=UPI00157559E4|nr:AsmA family protein [Sphingomonas bacterium]